MIVEKSRCNYIYYLKHYFKISVQFGSVEHPQCEGQNSDALSSPSAVIQSVSQSVNPLVIGMNY